MNEFGETISPVNRWTDFKKMWYILYNIYIHSMEYHSATRKKEILPLNSNMDGLRGHYAEWNKLDRGRDFPGSSVGKETACSAEDLGSIPGSRRAPGEGNSNPLQCSCLENPMDRGAWQATVYGSQESDAT